MGEVREVSRDNGILSDVRVATGYFSQMLDGRDEYQVRRLREGAAVLLNTTYRHEKWQKAKQIVHQPRV